MKKFFQLAVLVLAFFLTACNSSKNTTISNKDTSSSNADTASTAPEKNADMDTPDSPAAEDTVSPVNNNAPVLSIGDMISVDGKCEFYLDYVNITNDVMPPQPGNWYSHYEAEDGKVYVDICVAYKNLATRNIDADEVMTGTLIYSGRYEYNGFSMIEKDSRSDFTYSNIANIAPLSTEYVHYLFPVPEEIQTSGSAVDVILAIAGGEYKAIVKDGTTGVAASGSSDNAAQKTGGNISTGETVSTKNAEFFVDYANITSDVMPPHPANWYSHYEADNGKVYVDFCVGYKNISNRSVGADDVISAKLKYADKYDYTGFSMIEEDNRSDFTYSNITGIAPLNTEYIHYLFSVPEEVETSGDTIVISFRIDGNDYTYTVR